MFVEHHRIDSMCVYVYIRSHLHGILRLDAPRIRPMPRICTGLPWRRRLALESAHSLCQRLHDGALTFHEFNQLVMSCSHAVSWNLEDIPALSRAAKMRCVWDLKTVIASREAHDPKPQSFRVLALSAGRERSHASQACLYVCYSWAEGSAASRLETSSLLNDATADGRNDAAADSSSMVVARVAHIVAVCSRAGGGVGGDGGGCCCRCRRCCCGRYAHHAWSPPVL